MQPGCNYEDKLSIASVPRAVNEYDSFVSTDNRNVPLFKTIEMSPFVVVVHFCFPVVVEAVRKVEIRGVCGFPSAVGKSVLWTFPRSGFSTALRRRASRDCSSAAANLLLPRLSGDLKFHNLDRAKRKVQP